MYIFANCLVVHTYGTVYVPTIRYCVRLRAALEISQACHTYCSCLFDWNMYDKPMKLQMQQEYSIHPHNSTCTQTNDVYKMWADSLCSVGFYPSFVADPQ